MEIAQTAHFSFRTTKRWWDYESIYKRFTIFMASPFSQKVLVSTCICVYDNFDLVHRYPLGSADYEVRSVKTQGSQHSRDTKILSTHYWENPLFYHSSLWGKGWPYCRIMAYIGYCWRHFLFYYALPCTCNVIWSQQNSVCLTPIHQA